MVSLVGVPSLPAEINAASWLIKEVRVTTAIAYLHEEFELAQALVQDGRIDAGRLHTQTVALGGLGQAFDALATNPQQMKILVNPQA
jgi:threonine dehydrogenase-like Zn-dependent dehydrogenase